MADATSATFWIVHAAAARSPDSADSAIFLPKSSAASPAVLNAVPTLLRPVTRPDHAAFPALAVAVAALRPNEVTAVAALPAPALMPSQAYIARSRRLVNPPPIEPHGIFVKARPSARAPLPTSCSIDRRGLRAVPMNIRTDETRIPPMTPARAMEAA